MQSVHKFVFTAIWEEGNIIGKLVELAKLLRYSTKQLSKDSGLVKKSG